MFRNSIHLKILGLVIGVVTIGVIATLYLGYKAQERQLLGEKVRTIEFMARPILNSIYKDMLKARPDTVRHLIADLKQAEGVERVQIIRSNGVEEAFEDLKTIKAVKKRYGKTRKEWAAGHANKKVNVAEGVKTDEFISALGFFNEDWNRGAIYYIEGKDTPLFTYLKPIEMRPGCGACHGSGEARGILMITTSLDDMYIALSKTRTPWVASVILAIFMGGLLLSVLIRRSITGPIERTVNVIKDITEGGGGIKGGVKVSSTDEIGYLGTAFNKMLVTLEKREESNRKLFNEAIKSRAEWVSTFDAIQDFISIHDGDCSIVNINMALASHLGEKPESLIGKKCHEIYHEYVPGSFSSHSCPITRAFKAGETVAEEATGLMGADRVFEVSAYPVKDKDGTVTACVHIARDITEEKELKGRLLHSEKMSGIGQFISGIAHELNNPLTGIIGFSQILMEYPGEMRLGDKEISDKLDKIHRESLRSSRIVQDLLTFVRAGSLEKKFNDINQLIRETIELEEEALDKSNIKLEISFDEKIPGTMVDFYRIQQVFINLMTNAVDAMVSENSGGTLSISTSIDGDMIAVTFADDGPGIPEEILSQVFDPFFTTKAVGKGTGLGLSIVHGIIEEHGGSIDIKRVEPGGGTEFIVRLPVVEGRKMKLSKAVKAGEKQVARAPWVGKKVLVADDEESIRESLSEFLQKESFTVVTASSGEEVLDFITEDDVELYIIDVNMPGMDGREFHRAMLEKDEDIDRRTIFLIGDVINKDTEKFIKESNCECIMKPFKPHLLLELIDRTLLKW